MKTLSKNMLLYARSSRVNILGVHLNKLMMHEVLEIVKRSIALHQQLVLCVVNVAKIVHAQNDLRLRSYLDGADLILADGLPIVWLSRILGNPLPERVAGIDIMFKILKEANKKYYRVYFLGSKPKILQRVIEKIQRDYPGICIAGYRDGYFDMNQEQSVAENIKDSRADIIFVGISSPKKEDFLRKWGKYMNVPICHGVGGSFDILAGVTKRAPIWMQKCGLEWFYRLVQEPRRMWKRYLITNTIFIKLSLEAVFRARLNKLFRRIKVTSSTGAKDKVE
jgi:N-acetylglucosaminyldiphosphoundecaprenol N-acetyl-beta-D-mannosaminyltransferase